MKIGITLPTFGVGTGAALAVARAAEAGGLDGVFSFDHLWPMGRPGGPALWSFGVLGAVAARTARVRVGTLVARVGLRTADDLEASFAALVMIAGSGRVIAGLGVGDRLSAGENLAYGIAYPPPAQRLAAMGEMADRLGSRGIEAWIGGTSAATAGVATAHGVARNLWGVTAATLDRASVGDGHVRLTWGGQVLIGRDADELSGLRARFGDRPGMVVGTVAEVATRLRAMGTAGAAWCVCAPLDAACDPERSVGNLCRVAEAVR